MRRVLIILVLLGFVAAACGSDDSPGATTAATSTTTTVAPSTTASTTTTAPTTTAAPATTAGAIVPGEDPDVDAIVEAYTVAFDSTTTFEDKAPFLVDAAGLEDTVVQYTETGTLVGGVTVEVTEVVVDGDSAAVTFTLMFAGNPTYPGQTGDAVRTDGSWQITRPMFCGLMTSARVGCPAA